MTHLSPSSLSLSPPLSIQQSQHHSHSGLTTELINSSTNAQTLGKLGEEYTTRLLHHRGWKILERNYRTRYGEIDIICQSPQDCTVFVEVKTRRSHHYGTPASAVTITKQHHLRKAASAWLRDHHHSGTIRFDVASVLVHRDKVIFDYIETAF